MNHEPTEHTGDGGQDYTLEKIGAADPYLLDQRFKLAVSGCQRTVLPQATEQTSSWIRTEQDLANVLIPFLEKHPYKRVYWPGMRLSNEKKAVERKNALKAERPIFESLNVTIKRAALIIGHNFCADLKKILNEFRDMDHEMQRELRTLKHLLER